MLQIIENGIWLLMRFDILQIQHPDFTSVNSMMQEQDDIFHCLLTEVEISEFEQIPHQRSSR